MPGAKWFPGARVNYARHILRHADTYPDGMAGVTPGVLPSALRAILNKPSNQLSVRASATWSMP